MLQISNVENLEEKDIVKLLNKVQPILNKRQELYKRWARDAEDSALFYSPTDKKTKLSLEQFIVTIASGYFAGKAPVYTIKETSDEEKAKIIEDLIGRDKKENSYKKSMEVMIDYITDYNDDETEHYRLATDALKLTSCYEILYQSTEGEIVYGNYSPLQTVAIWDYSVPANLVGLVRTWQEENIDNKTVTMVELTDKTGIRRYEVTGGIKKKVELVDNDEHNWGDVPAIVYESEMAIFENVVDLIKALEQVIQNNRNIHQYNDDAKLAITGYMPENQMYTTIEVDGVDVRIANPDRIKEDKFILESRVVYLGEGGKMEWLIKDVNDGATQNTIKTDMELILMLSCVPNITDTGFTNADNNSAIQNKYFALAQRLTELSKGFKMMYLRRWELIFNRINLIKNTKFDFRDVKIELPVNIPTNEADEIDTILKLQNVISDETLINKLGYDYLDEKKKLEAQAEENINSLIERNNALGQSGASL